MVVADDEWDDEDDYDVADASTLECFWCGGEGYVEGSDPGWDEGEFVLCPSCRCSGLRKDMTLM